MALVSINNDYQICLAALIEKVSINPNPVIDNLTIVVARKTAVKVDILIHNAIGQVVYKQTNQQTAGQKTYTIPMKKMNGGIYFVQVYLNDEKVIVKKVVLQ